MSKHKKPKKPVSVDINVDGNHLHVNRDNNALDVKYDGKNRDVNYYNSEDSKIFNYDGKKLDIEIEKNEKGTTVIIESSNGILKTIGKFITSLVLKRFKK